MFTFETLRASSADKDFSNREFEHYHYQTICALFSRFSDKEINVCEKKVYIRAVFATFEFPRCDLKAVRGDFSSRGWLDSRASSRVKRAHVICRRIVKLIIGDFIQRQIWSDNGFCIFARGLRMGAEIDEFNLAATPECILSDDDELDLVNLDRFSMVFLGDFFLLSLLYRFFSQFESYSCE